MDEPQSVLAYRYERKFLVDQMDAQQVRGMVRRHPAMFYEPYPPRYVNNLYLDTEGMENYFDNVSGASDRCKVRIRWYFATKDQRFRVTIDTQMTFYQMRKAVNRFLYKHVDYNHVVVELKYAQPLDVEADRISSFFPFSLTKNSKYVTGIERVYV